MLAPGFLCVSLRLEMSDYGSDPLARYPENPFALITMIPAWKLTLYFLSFV